MAIYFVTWCSLFALLIGHQATGQPPTTLPPDSIQQDSLSWSAPAHQHTEKNTRQSIATAGIVTVCIGVVVFLLYNVRAKN